MINKIYNKSNSMCNIGAQECPNPWHRASRVPISARMKFGFWERNLWGIGNTKLPLRLGVSQLVYLPYHVAFSGGWRELSEKMFESNAQGQVHVNKGEQRKDGSISTNNSIAAHSKVKAVTCRPHWSSITIYEVILSAKVSALIRKTRNHMTLYGA